MAEGTSAFEELLQFLYLTPIGVVKFGADGAIDLINPEASRLLLPVVPGSDLTNLYAALMPLVPEMQQLVQTFGPRAGCIVSRQRLEAQVAGKSQVLSLTLERVDDAVYMAVIEDVTSLVEHEKKLLADQQRFRAIFENVRDCAIFTITLDGLIEEWNQTLERFGDWGPADVEGRHIGIFFPPDDPNARSPEALLAQAGRAGSVETEGWRLRRDGSSLWANMVVTALPDERGAVTGFVVVARDMTERKRLEDHLGQLATVDPLTGAFNRRYGQDALNTEFERRKRTSLSFAVLMLDVDSFKAINDTFGHDAGDAVLCTIVRACKADLRVLDVLARWGGEEFLVVLPGTTPEGAVVTAERLRETLAALQVPLDRKRSTRFTVSIGVAAPSPGDDSLKLLRRADRALYAAKNNGRNRVVLDA